MTKTIIGEKWGKLTILKGSSPIQESNGSYSKMVTAQCECGKIKTVRYNSLKFNLTKSCGCLKRRKRKDGPLKSSIKRPPEYDLWKTLRKRNKEGVIVHQEWLSSFKTLLNDIGPKPSPNHWFKKIDNNKGFIPGNANWISKYEKRN